MPQQLTPPLIGLTSLAHEPDQETNTFEYNFMVRIFFLVHLSKREKEKRLSDTRFRPFQDVSIMKLKNMPLFINFAKCIFSNFSFRSVMLT